MESDLHIPTKYIKRLVERIDGIIVTVREGPVHGRAVGEYNASLGSKVNMLDGYIDVLRDHLAEKIEEDNGDKE